MAFTKTPFAAESVIVSLKGRFSWPGCSANVNLWNNLMSVSFACITTQMCVKFEIAIAKSAGCQPSCEAYSIARKILLLGLVAELKALVCMVTCLRL